MIGGRHERGRKEGREGGREGGKEYLQMHGARQEATPFLPLVQVKAPSVVEAVLPVPVLVDAAVEVELRRREGRGEGGREGGIKARSGHA